MIITSHNHNTIITLENYVGTMEPHYNKDLGTMKIIHQICLYIRVKKKQKKNYKELGPEW